MKYTDKLIQSRAFEQNNDLFFKSLQEICVHHYQKCDYFRFVFDSEDMDVSTMNDSDLYKLPFINVDLFKTVDFYNSNYEDFVLHLTSSGTSGQKSQTYLDKGSLRRVKESAYNIYHELGVTSTEKCNYLCFTYDPKVANDLGTAFTDELLTSFTPKGEVFYAFQWNEKDNDFFFDKEKTINKLKEFEKSSLPLRILGFPAHLYFLLLENEIHLELPENSWLLTGGGWKGHENQKIDRDKFKVFVSERLSIPFENQRDLFGMVEHGIAYLEDESAKFRIPNYSRIIIRDPLTLEPKSYGQKGIVQFICTYNTSYPVVSILSTDWGIVHRDHKGEYIEFLGRAGIKKQNGCALNANRLIQ